jgi:DNA-directed RNA polymerase subunit RPC12/RpoP
MYKCTVCKKIIEKLGERTRCPYCGARILIKIRPKVIKEVVAR